MPDLFPLDRQLADLLWIMVTAVRAGYSLPDMLRQLANEAPDPAGIVCGRAAAALEDGSTPEQALADWQKAVPSKFLPQVSAAILEHVRTDKNLADLLEPVGETIYKLVGSDHSLDAAMRALAQSVHARMPERG